jgi:hypothetical protein
MNLFIVRAFGFFMGVILLIGVVSLAVVRRGTSEAYWLIDNGTRIDDFQNGLYRMLPDGGMRRPILFDFVPRANGSEIYWIEGRSAFLYPECDAGQLTIVRQSALSGRAEWIETGAAIGQNCPWEVMPSPNGKKLLMRIFDGGAHALIITEADGSKPIVLTETFNSIVGSETWSPDSESIYFGAFSPMGGGIHRVRADGKAYERVAVIRFLDSPMWSSDGGLLTFITNGYFHQLNVETGDFRQLTDSADAQYERAAWINDEWMVTVGNHAGGRSLYRLTTAGGDPSMLIFGILNSRYVVTADGMAVVLAGETDAQAMFGVEVETGRRWSISETGFWFSELILSSDEEWVYFASTMNGENSIYRARVDGSTVERLYGMGVDDRAVELQITPDNAWLLVAYADNTVSSQRLHRVRINFADGHVERLPDGTMPMASGLIDLGWRYGILIVMGWLLMVVAGGWPAVVGLVGRKL